jgi:formylglycine-generating enzyme required for sulfatase activity
VSWIQVKSYVAWLARKTGKSYRLLTEAEREYVTRAGTKTAFWWSSEITPTQANYNATGDLLGKRPLPVDSFDPNTWGLYQVHGNVWEWTEDCWNDNNKGNPGDGTARKTGDCAKRVVRGGSWMSSPAGLRADYRTSFPAGYTLIFAPGTRSDLIAQFQSFDLGFRVARSL